MLSKVLRWKTCWLPVQRAPHQSGAGTKPKFQRRGVNSQSVNAAREVSSNWLTANQKEAWEATARLKPSRYQLRQLLTLVGSGSWETGGLCSGFGCQDDSLRQAGVTVTEEGAFNLSVKISAARFKPDSGARVRSIVGKMDEILLYNFAAFRSTWLLQCAP